MLQSGALEQPDHSSCDHDDDKTDHGDGHAPEDQESSDKPACRLRQARWWNEASLSEPRYIVNLPRMASVIPDTMESASIAVFIAFNSGREC